MTGPDRPSGAGTFWLAVVDAGSSLADSRAAGGPPIAAIRSKFVVSHPAFLPGIRTLASRNTTSMPVDIVFVPDWVTNLEVMWEEAAIARFLTRHDTAVRQELGRFRGREIHTTGDGFFATFDGPARAVRCALAIREAVRPLGLEIRTGLHTGECELRGDDVSGIAVHIGARVAAAANAGEVLVSGTLKDLVTGSGLRFVERGVHRLKGVEGEWPLHAAE